jgi:hypothetical protein
VKTNPDRLCPCHGEPMMHAKDGRHYCATKRRAAWRKATRARLETEAGRAAAEDARRRRIFIGHTYHSRAKTVELAQTINGHISARLRGFTAARRVEACGGERDV